MPDDTAFTPDWISPPGDTIATILEERGLSIRDLARKLHQSPSDVQNLITGHAVVTGEIATRLAAEFGSTANFWTKRELRYRQDLIRWKKEASRAASAGWLSRLPVDDMVRWGWIKAARDQVAQAVACLQFFGVSSMDAWEQNYSDLLKAVAFRTSSTFKSEAEAVATWLRQGEIEASSIRCQVWAPNRFRDVLSDIRRLTREPDPEIFLPKLIRQCASCGVAVVAIRAPKKCRASGATRFLSPERPMLLFSFRYRSDDHFWFTFFHEAAHLLLHADSDVFVEGDDKLPSQKEDEANAFAEETLVPPEFRQEMLRLPAQKIPVMRFARKIGISRGIVVGQLQHHGIIRRDQLNGLKARYTWDDE